MAFIICFCLTYILMMGFYQWRDEGRRNSRLGGMSAGTKTSPRREFDSADWTGR